MSYNAVAAQDVEAFFSTDALNKRRVAFRARIENVRSALGRRLEALGQEHVKLIEKFASDSVHNVARQITTSGLVDAIEEAFTQLAAFTPDVDPAETWEREAVLRRLSMLREQVRMLKAELRQHQAAYNTLAASHTSLLHFTNALRSSLWTSVNSIALEMRARDDHSGSIRIIEAFNREWPRDVAPPTSQLKELQLLNDRGNSALQYSEEADDAIKELVASAVAEARGEERAKTKAAEEQLRELEASIPTRVAEAVRMAKDSMKNNAALFETLKGEYEQRIDELSDLVETMKTEASRRVDDVRTVVMQFTKANVGIDIGRTLASNGTDERRLADAILKQEELKMDLLRQKMEHKVEQQALHRTLKAANLRLARIRPEEDIVAEAQAPLNKTIEALKLDVLSWSERAAALAKDVQRSHEQKEAIRAEHQSMQQKLDAVMAKMGTGKGTAVGLSSTTQAAHTSAPRAMASDAAAQRSHDPRQRTAHFILPDDTHPASLTPPSKQSSPLQPQLEVEASSVVLPAEDNAPELVALELPQHERTASSFLDAPLAGDRTKSDDVVGTIAVDAPAPPAPPPESVPQDVPEELNPRSTAVEISEVSPEEKRKRVHPDDDVHSASKLTPHSRKPPRQAAVRGSSVLDAMVHAALRASAPPHNAPSSLMAVKGRARGNGASQNAPMAEVGWKPMDLVKVLLAATAVQMVQRTLEAPISVGNSSGAGTSSASVRHAATQTPTVRGEPKTHEQHRHDNPQASNQSPAALHQHQPTRPPPPRPRSAIHSFPRSVPSVSRVHRRNIGELSLLPQRFLSATEPNQQCTMVSS